MEHFKQDARGMYYIDRTMSGKRCHLRAKTEKELRAKIAEWQRQQDKIKLDQERGATFGDVARDWFDSLTVRHGTVHGYKCACEYWVGELGQDYIAEITPADINNGLKRLAARGYARHTVANYRAVINRIFDHWVTGEWRGNNNPVLLTKTPQNAKKGETRTPPPDAMVDAIKAHPDGFGFAALLFMYTGIRLGEANALRVSDIDLTDKTISANGCIHVRRACPWAGNTPYEQETKTENGVRDIPIFSAFLPYLLDRIQDLAPDDYLLSMCKEPLTQSQYKARWSDYCKSIGYAVPVDEPLKKNGKTYKRVRWQPMYTAHQFRHYFATACYTAQVPELVAQKMLGHADITTTHKVYTHIRDQLIVDNAANLDRYFSAVNSSANPTQTPLTQ